MPKLSQAQIEMYAQSAGMQNPKVMAAIAMAESGGSTTAHNPLPPDNSYGLWQINMLGSMGPSRRRQFGITSNEQLFDPAVNAKAAAQILNGQGLKAWSTYTDGAYKRYMGAAGAVPTDWSPLDPFGILPDGTTDRMQGTLDPLGLGDVATGVGGIAEAAQKAGEWMSNPKNWLRIAYVAGGAVLVGIGLYIVAAPLVGKVAASSPAAQIVKKVAGGAKGGGAKGKAVKSTKTESGS